MSIKIQPKTAKPVKAILTDIEGTTTSISFVYDSLFPYARARLKDFLQQHASRVDVAAQIQAAASEAGIEATAEAAGKQMLQWMDDDKKVGPLKAIQGMIWQAGYEDGSLKGHVYTDAVENLRKWHQQGLALYVYSSGSVQAQRLIFGYSKFGDLTPLFTGYFDTAVGGKREPASYSAIQAEIGLPAEQILFLSDIDEELHAAAMAGMQTRHVVRDAETAVNSDAQHPTVATFNDIHF